MNIQKLAHAFGSHQEKHPWAYVGVSILILVLSLPGLGLLIGHVEPSLEKVLPSDIQEIRTMNAMRAQFGADMMHIVLVAQPPLSDVLDPQAITYMQDLTLRLKDREFIRGVQSISDIIQTPIQSEEQSRELRENPFIHNFVTYDRSIAVIHVQTDTGATAKTIELVSQDIQAVIAEFDAQNSGFSVSLTGFNAIDRATFRVIISDFMKITGVSFGLLLLFLFVYFRSVKRVFISITLLLLSVMITLGIVGYSTMTITVVTMVSAAMIMALGISYAINILYEYDSLPKKRIATLQENLVVALVGSSLTTIAGFLALLFGVMPAMKNLGIVLAIGILVTVLVGIITIPALIWLLEKKHETHTQ
jgi:predicted RND superfamily exporter protein